MPLESQEVLQVVGRNQIAVLELRSIVRNILHSMADENTHMEYNLALSDPDITRPVYIRGLKRLWECFHLLEVPVAIMVLALLDKAQEEQGGVTFYIRQLITSDVPRLYLWIRDNHQSIRDYQPRPHGPRPFKLAQDLLNLAKYRTDLNHPRQDLQEFGRAIEDMELHERGSDDRIHRYRAAAAVMRRIAFLANHSRLYLSIMSGPPLAATVLRLMSLFEWDEWKDQWDHRRSTDTMQLPFVVFLNAMTDLSKNLPGGFMASLREAKETIMAKFEL
jgi:hypothetical protein